jgi:hypothetical protein
VHVRTVAISVGATLLAVVVGLVGADFGAAIFAEYRLSQTLRTEARLPSDPVVAILGFPFLTQVADHHYDEVELRAPVVDDPEAQRISLEATLHSIDLQESSWLIRPDAALPVAKVESRILIDSRHVGRFMGITDLMVEAPTADTNDATGGTTESGISGSRGLVFSGTPRSAGLDERVSVSVDLSMAGADQTTLVFTGTDILTGPGTAGQEVSDDDRAAVLKAFSTALPGQRLPFGVAPTSQGVRGSDVIIEGIATDQILQLDEFRQP